MSDAQTRADRQFAPIAAELRAHQEREVARADFSGFADRVLARVQAEQPVPFWEKARVWLRESLTFHPVRMALAAAAALAIAVGGPAALLAPAPGSGVSLSELDFGPRGGVVFQAEDTTVIWIGDTQ